MLADTRRPSALAAQLAGARANPAPAWVATISGVINGATMVLGAAAIGWSTDHLVVPALGRKHVPPSAWWISALFILGISAIRWTSILFRGVATGRVQYHAQAETRRAVARRHLELDLGWHRRRSPGQLLAHAVSDVDALWLPMQFAYFALGMVFMLLLALAELFLRDVLLGLVGVVRLSIGERQLVALARTALVDPDLVVLDEATSGLDPATDVAIQEALAVLTRNRTPTTA
jgi:ATP-binding cassette subfamily B protein